MMKTTQTRITSIIESAESSEEKVKQIRSLMEQFANPSVSSTKEQSAGFNQFSLQKKIPGDREPPGGGEDLENQKEQEEEKSSHRPISNMSMTSWKAIFHFKYIDEKVQPLLLLRDEL